MNSRILTRPAADRDLDDQAEYLATRQSLQTGLRFYRAAEETFRMLAARPKMGRPAECRSPLLLGMRILPVNEFPRHLVFYRVVEGGVEIVRVLHGARDLERMFEE